MFFRTMWLRRIRSIVVSIAAFLCVVPALACETVDPPPTPVALERQAVDSFNREPFVYEGVVLDDHDPEKGGRFLVLKSIKGPAKFLDVVRLGTGTSCYRGARRFALGFLVRNASGSDAFDGLVEEDYVEIWKKHGLVDGSGSAWFGRMFALVVLVVAIGGAALLGLWRRRGTKTI